MTAYSPSSALRSEIQPFLVTADEMQQIESRIFEAGMPVAALMEKVAGRITQALVAQYPRSRFARVGILVGPGHNGGDALVVGRELHFQGYEVKIFQPLSKLKKLTDHHAQYAWNLGIPFAETVTDLQDCDLIVDGLFGFGLGRPLENDLAAAVNQINHWTIPVLSIDLPSGIATDSGEVMGTAIRAATTCCLGLWKRAFVQDAALDFIGQPWLIDFDIPLADIRAVLGKNPQVQRLLQAEAIARLPLPRPAASHKYKAGHLLLICGSRRYQGAAILSGLGAKASGVGMLSIAVPETLRATMVATHPEALIIGCPETEGGAIAQLPDNIELSSFQAVAIGPGLTREAQPLVETCLESDRPLLLDADGLNCLAELNPIERLSQRSAPTVLTPHPGEFKRLFPKIRAQAADAGEAAQMAAQQTGAVILLKGARTAIAHPDGQLWFNPESTSALARGGSGDVLTGLMGGLMAQHLAAGRADAELQAILDAALDGVWWHAQAGIAAAQEQTDLGVDPTVLAAYLTRTLSRILKEQ
ncbi:MAG: NAD(P)H-hydrate dehydratase [Leptolyngbya sp. SIO4C5]|nr:NAD(P)H-hydrate dehydratase [Leptolyngbya sp. SIO4C5]